MLDVLCAACSTSEACHSSHIYCCTHPVMKEPLAACPAAPTLHLYPELNSSPNSANTPFHYCCLEGEDSHGLTPWKDSEASARTHSKRQVDLLFLVQCSLCRSGPCMEMLLERHYLMTTTTLLSQALRKIRFLAPSLC